MSQANTNSVVDLINTIDTKLKKVNTQSLDLSFNELVDMKKDGELNITPEFQRLFRWSEGAQSRFIESLLLEMPVPPIYVIEDQEGKYILIDGLQRISTYLHLRGELSATHLDPPINIGEKLVFTDCDIVPELNGKSWDDLGVALQIRLKRAFIRVEVVRKGSDPRFQYHMFKRLNTGGAILQPQQIRNCTIRLLNPVFNDFIIALSENPDFKQCVSSITDEQFLSSFDQELVLRFFALKNKGDQFKHDVSDFLTEYMEEVSDPESGSTFNYVTQKKDFEKTFKILSKTMGELAFGYFNKKKVDIVRAFGVYQYEAFTIGLQPLLTQIDLQDLEVLDRIKVEIKNIKHDTAFISLVTGGGKNSAGPFKSRVKFVTDRINSIL